MTGLLDLVVVILTCCYVINAVIKQTLQWFYLPIIHRSCDFKQLIVVHLCIYIAVNTLFEVAIHWGERNLASGYGLSLFVPRNP